MKVVEYSLESGVTPTDIVNGGYWPNGGTLIGVAEDTSLKTELTVTQVMDRAVLCDPDSEEKDTAELVKAWYAAHLTQVVNPSYDVNTITRLQLKKEIINGTYSFNWGNYVSFIASDSDEQEDYDLSKHEVAIDNAQVQAFAADEGLTQAELQALFNAASVRTTI